MNLDVADNEEERGREQLQVECSGVVSLQAYVVQSESTQTKHIHFIQN